MTVDYYSRGSWDRSGAGRLGFVVPVEQFTGLAIHHTVTNPPPDGNVAAIFAHMEYLRTLRPDLGEDVPYSFVVFRGTTNADSVVCEGRGPGRTGAHTAGFNSTRYGVACVGNFVNDPVTAGIIDGIRFVGETFAPWASSPTLGHQQFPDPPLDHTRTACCGTHLFEVMGRLQPPFINVPIPAPIPEDEDMLRRVMDEDGTGYILDGMKAYPMSGYPMAVHEAIGDVLPYERIDDKPENDYLRVDKKSLALAYEIQPVK